MNNYCICNSKESCLQYKENALFGYLAEKTWADKRKSDN